MGDVLCGRHQRALPSGLLPLAGAASSADGTKGRCPQVSRPTRAFSLRRDGGFYTHIRYLEPVFTDCQPRLHDSAIL